MITQSMSCLKEKIPMCLLGRTKRTKRAEREREREKVNAKISQMVMVFTAAMQLIQLLVSVHTVML